MEKHQTQGYIMAVVGFVMILINALSYIFSWDMKSSAFTIMGIIFVLIGLKIAREKSK